MHSRSMRWTHVAAILGCFHVVTVAIAGGSGFTYQGRLTDSAGLVNGPTDLTFSLCDSAVGGNLVAGPLVLSGVPVTAGLFTVELDFGADAFDGADRWLEIVIGSQVLSPRTKIASVPYAIRARQLNLPFGGTVASPATPDAAFSILNFGLGDAIRGIEYGSGRAGYFEIINPANANPALYAKTNGDAPAILADGLIRSTSGFEFPDSTLQISAGWSLSGNAGTDPATHFIGTTDDQPLELKVNGVRAFRIEPNVNGPNIVGGDATNQVIGDVYGATICGGYRNSASGWDSTIGGGYLNSATKEYSSIGGGQQNIASGYNSSIAGGYSNNASEAYSTVGGGFDNIASGAYSTVPGGVLNAAGGRYSLAAGHGANVRTAAQVGGDDTDGDEGTFIWADSTDDGFTSTGPDQFLIRASGGVGIGTNSPTAKLHIGGVPGTDGIRFPDNTLQTSAGWGLAGNAGTNPDTHFIGTTDDQPLELKVNGVRALRIEPNADVEVEYGANIVAGHHLNEVAPEMVCATISGGGRAGYPNRVERHYGTVGGGAGNTAGGDSSTVGGGWSNSANALGSTVGGGWGNISSAEDSTVGGGWDNSASAVSSTVAGGESNIASGTRGTVGGGGPNGAAGWSSTVGGGGYNWARGASSTIGGGFGNGTSGTSSTVPGGAYNDAGGDNSLAAGHRAKVRTAAQVGGDDTDGDEGTFVWADSTDADFTSTGPNQFNVRANGGVLFDTGQGPGVHLNAANRPLITRGHDPFTSGTHIGAGRWGLFMEPHTLALGMPAIAGKSVQVVKYNADSTYSPLATFDQNGNVGVGISPSYKLHVNGSVAGVSDYVNLSDGRFKKNVEPIADAVRKVSRLNGVSFDWRQDDHPELNLDDNRHLGLIAQEVEQILPEAVSKDGEGRYSVAYSAVIPVLVEAVKSLDGENQTLKKQNQQLEARLAAIEAAVSKLAARSEGGRP